MWIVKYDLQLVICSTIQNDVSGTECIWNPKRIGFFVDSVASLVQLQSTGPICLSYLLFYSCCNLGRLLPISKRVSFNRYLELVLFLILILVRHSAYPVLS
jgi:hypothetical protein